MIKTSLLTLKLLAQHLEFISEIVSWKIKEFNYLNPDRTNVDVLKSVQQHLNINKLPITYVLLLNNKIIGTASLRPIDLETYQQVTPWLGSVIIATEYRNQGIGTYMINAIMKEAFKFGHKKWYLYTADRASFYEEMGWQKIDETSCNGVIGDVMLLESSKIASYQ